MSVKWQLHTNYLPEGCEWGTLWRDADRRIPWHTPRPEDRGQPASYDEPRIASFDPTIRPYSIKPESAFTFTVGPIIDPPKPRRNNGPIAWRRIPVWLLSKALRWT